MQLSIAATFFLGLASFASAQQLTPAEIIKHIAPDSASCADKSDECRTAEQAAPFIFRSFCQYGIQHPNQIAAVISLMALESGEFAYKRNAFPGRPGQGTANMQMPPFNLKYAKSLEDVRDEVADIDSTDGLPDAELDRILDLVVVDEHNFGSGAWFIRSECPQSVLDALEADIDTGFEEYMACVGVEVDEGRLAYLTKAKEAFDL
jgi:hypothetical protein